MPVPTAETYAHRDSRLTDYFKVTLSFIFIGSDFAGLTSIYRGSSVTNANDCAHS